MPKSRKKTKLPRETLVPSDGAAELVSFETEDAGTQVVLDHKKYEPTVQEIEIYAENCGVSLRELLSQHIEDEEKYAELAIEVPVVLSRHQQQGNAAAAACGYESEGAASAGSFLNLPSNADGITAIGDQSLHFEGADGSTATSILPPPSAAVLKSGGATGAERESVPSSRGSKQPSECGSNSQILPLGGAGGPAHTKPINTPNSDSSKSQQQRHHQMPMSPASGFSQGSRSLPMVQASPHVLSLMSRYRNFHLQAVATLKATARSCWKAPLSRDVGLCRTEGGNEAGEVYFFNFETGESSWVHPDAELHAVILEKAYQKVFAKEQLFHRLFELYQKNLQKASDISPRGIDAMNRSFERVIGTGTGGGVGDTCSSSPATGIEKDLFASPVAAAVDTHPLARAADGDCVDEDDELNFSIEDDDALQLLQLEQNTAAEDLPPIPDDLGTGTWERILTPRGKRMLLANLETGEVVESKKTTNDENDRELLKHDNDDDTGIEADDDQGVLQQQSGSDVDDEEDEPRTSDLLEESTEDEDEEYYEDEQEPSENDDNSSLSGAVFAADGDIGVQQVISGRGVESPTETELGDYAEWLGIRLRAKKKKTEGGPGNNPKDDSSDDDDNERDLLWIAKEGLAQDCPVPWKMVHDEESGNDYYFNFDTGESSWEHPLDEYYKDLVKAERAAKIRNTAEEQEQQRHAAAAAAVDSSDLYDILSPNSDAKNEKGSEGEFDDEENDDALLALPSPGSNQETVEDRVLRDLAKEANPRYRRDPAMTFKEGNKGVGGGEDSERRVMNEREGQANSAPTRSFRVVPTVVVGIAAFAAGLLVGLKVARKN